MSAEAQYDKQRRHEIHRESLHAPDDDGETTQILEQLSKIDDLPIDPTEDAVMGQLISKLASTTNLTAEEVRSNEWVREYILILYLCKFPTDEGMHGAWRGWAHGDQNAAREPLDPETRMMLEAHVTNSKLALKRSEEAKVIEESTRHRSESFVHDDGGEDSGGGGILGRLRRS